MELFRVFGTIGLEDGEAKKKLKDIDNEAHGLTGRITKTGVAIGTAFGNIIAQGVVKLGKAVAGVGPSLVTAAADAEALGAQFSQVFGDLEKEATTNMNKIAEETGILPNRLKGSFAQMAAFAKTTGASTADALSLTERATLAAADSAAFYDKSIESVTESLQSFLKGNFENDAALGISATETTRNAKANELYGQSFKDLDEAQKQLTLLAMVEDGNKLSGALGQAARESDGLENQMGNLRQAWQDIKVKFGEPILEPAVRGIQKLTDWLMNVDTSKVTDFFEWSVSKLPIVQGVFSQVFGVIKDVANQVWDYFKENILPIFIQLFDDVQTNLPIIQQTFKTVFDAIVNVATTVWDFFKKNILPIFVSLFTWVQGHMPTIRATFQTVFTKVVEVAKMVWNFFKNNILPILQNFLGFIQKNMPTIQRIVENVFKIIADVVKVVWDIFENFLLPVLKALWDYIAAPAFKKIQTIVQDVFSAIFEAVDAVVWVFEKVTGAIQKAVDWLSSWNNKKVSKKTVEVEERRTSSGGGGSRAFATGTNFAPGGVALVGERGPELVELPRGSKVKTANQTKELLSGQRNITIQPAPIYLDNVLVGEVLFNTMDNMFNSNAQMQLYMKGARG